MLATALFVAPLTILAAEGRKPAIVDPAFGETLYAFYQKQYFDAISRLLVARERQEFHRQADEAELLLGGLYVQYGVPDAAGKIFAKFFPDAGDSPQVQRIWLALAELNYRRDRFADALAIVGQRFVRESAPEQAVVLAVKSLMRLGRYREAADWLGPNISDLPESRYLRFNIAVALVADGDAEGGAAMFMPLLALPAEDEEMHALRDRVTLALAATRLQQQRPADAVAALAGAQLDGPYSDEALLVYGIAAMRNGETKKALRSLLPLVKRSPHEQAVQEGAVALAQAYEFGGDERRALAAYRAALQLLEGELGYLDAQQAAIDKGEWFAELENRASDITLRDDRAGLADNDVLGLPLHYRQFASNRFVLTFAQYVEVRRLARLAVDWRERISVMAYLVTSRIERHGRLADEAQALLAAAPVEPLAARQLALAQRVEGDIAGGNLLALANQKQQLLAALIADLSTKMQRWPQHDWSAQRARLAVLKGVLEWDVARDQPEQAWALRRTVRDSARLVDEAGVLRARVEKALRREVVSVDGWQQELVAEAARLQALVTQSAGLLSLLRKQMEDDARETIRNQRVRVVQLAADSYYGIGQLEHGAWRAQRDARRRMSDAEVP